MVLNTELYLQRSVLSYKVQQGVDTMQLNPIAKAVFGVASVTFEVRARYWRMRGRGNSGPFSS